MDFLQSVSIPVYTDICGRVSFLNRSSFLPPHYKNNRKHLRNSETIEYTGCFTQSKISSRQIFTLTTYQQL